MKNVIVSCTIFTVPLCGEVTIHLTLLIVSIYPFPYYMGYYFNYHYQCKNLPSLEASVLYISGLDRA